MIIQASVEEKIKQAMDCSHLEVINESSKHNVPPGSESHFKCIIVSSQFENQMRVQRHQSIYQLLKEELDGAIHALALHTYTPEEWAEKGFAPKSPDCKGGSKQDA